MPRHFVQRLKDFILLSCRFIFILGIKCFISFVACSRLRDSRGATLRKRENENKTRGNWGEEGRPSFFPPPPLFPRSCARVLAFILLTRHPYYVRGWKRLPHLRPWRRAASFPVVLGDLGCDVTFPACRENISLGSKPPLVTLVARTGLGTRP